MHIFFFIVGYIYFIKAFDKATMLHLTCNEIDYYAGNKLSIEKVILNPSSM